MKPNPQRPRKYIRAGGHIYELEKLVGNPVDNPDGLYDFDMMFGEKTTLGDSVDELLDFIVNRNGTKVGYIYIDYIRTYEAAIRVGNDAEWELL